MNERIRRLMEQAVISIDGQTFGKTYIPDEFTEKFAELIVRECADIFGREGAGEYQVDGNWIAKTIKQHFGVRE